MSMVSTVRAQSEYYFPLPPQVSATGDSGSNANSANSSPRAKVNHSRQYTVGFLADEERVPQPTLLAPSRGSPSLSSKPSSPRHAHKRSAAVSHDFGLDKGFIEKLHQSSGHGSSNPLYSLQSPALTFASSTSSLPLQSTYSLVSSTTSLPDTSVVGGTAQPKVAFVISGNVTANNAQHHYQPTGPAEGEKRPTKHKKMKSWAGNLIRFRSSRKEVKKQPHIMEVDCLPNFTSSSYVPTEELRQPSTGCSSPSEPEPIIDLDAALGPFRTPHALSTLSNSSDGLFSFHQQHRRSESAPEISQAPGVRGMKRKMGPVVEEESIAESVEESASSSVVSLVSSSRLSTKSSGYSRNYKNALSALSAASLNSHNSSQASLISDGAVISKHNPPASTKVAARDTTTDGHKSSGLVTPQKSNDDSIMTIRPIKSKSNTVVASQFDLGEPGPEIRMSLDSMNMSIPSSPSKSYKPSRSQDSLASSNSLRKRNMAKRAWRWVRNRVSGDSLQG
jgi:hypothetical protein